MPDGEVVLAERPMISAHRLVRYAGHNGAW